MRSHDHDERAIREAFVVVPCHLIVSIVRVNLEFRSVTAEIEFRGAVYQLGLLFSETPLCVEFSL